MLRHSIMDLGEAGARKMSMGVKILLLWLAGFCCSTFAHDVPASLVMLDIGRRVIDVELQLQLNELGAGLDLPLASSPSTVIPRYGSQIDQYLEERLQIRSRDGRLYALRIESLDMRRTDNDNWSSNDWLIVHARALAPEDTSTEIFKLNYSVIFQRVLSHQAMIYVRHDLRNNLLGEKPMLIGVMGFGKAQLDVDGSDGRWCRGFGRLFAMGMQHIAQGSDHLLFLLALLLPAPLLAIGRRWQPGKSVANSMRTIVKVVSGFTLGHSLTLGLAAAGWIVAPARIVETLIAVSVFVSSIHAWRPLFAGKEVWIATGFGFIHGLAFAETLSGLNFDGFTLALSLLGFNLGIESMQLLVIAVTLPIMILLSSTRLYGPVRLLGAGFTGACALGWIAERAFEVSNPLRPMADWMTAPPGWFIACLCLVSGASICLLFAEPLVGHGGQWRRQRSRT
jgi:HupE / UreJ protein